MIAEIQEKKPYHAPVFKEISADEFARSILHAHKCGKCGKLRGCAQSPCRFRPFDVDPTTRERYVCC